MARTRPLSPAEQAAWDRVRATVEPLNAKAAVVKPAIVDASPPTKAEAPSDRREKRQQPERVVQPERVRSTSDSLDGQWERRLSRGQINPEVSIDLHGMTMTQAYHRLDATLEQAIAGGFRAILLVTGKQRDHDRVRGEGRGAIRASIADWLDVSRHGAHISAVRRAHPRHGGDGALYVILKRRR